ncbi:MAG: hypothetical protein OES13_00455 [Acidimicrobiia bacterium]|nr:hypothetical protein [Acidimicrobiia bacterium]
MRRKFGSFRDRWKLESYGGPAVPTVFYGMYGDPELTRLRDHRSLAVVVWCGTDAMRNARRALLKRENIRHVSTSVFISDTLSTHGLEYRELNVVGSDLSHFQPEPPGDTVYAYVSRRNPAMYGAAVLNQVRELLPDVEFEVIGSPTDLSFPDGIRDAYRRAGVGVRFTPHDGAACQVLEMGCMGRRTVHNGRSPSAISWIGAEDAARSITFELENPEPYEEVARRTREFVVDSPEWLEVEPWQ